MHRWPSAAREAVVLALLLSIAMVLHSLERMVPLPQVAPGVKLGLANSASLVGLFVLPYSRILVLVILRSLLASLFSGGPTVFVFSAVGGVASATAMYLALTYGYRAFSIVSVSVVGALVHNAGQLLTAMAMTGASRLYVYLPVLVVSGGVTGFVVGVISLELLRRLVRINTLRTVFLEDACRRHFAGCDR